jgi:hypothetical protein
MRFSTELQHLLQMAMRFHFDEAREAHGRCFAATLELAALAERKNITVELVRWQVQEDHDFCDHWAVVYGRNTVIDLTRVQVDGNAGLVHSIASYPANYCRPRFYPSEVLLPQFRRLGELQLNRLPLWFMWESGLALTRHDIATAFKARRWGGLLLSLADTLKFGLRSLFIALRYHLILDVHCHQHTLPPAENTHQAHQVQIQVLAIPVGPTQPFDGSN